MEWYVILGYILFGCFAVGMIVFGIVCNVKQRKSIMDRARKIDPTVKTISEASYVLQKDIAESVGTKKNKD